MKIVQLTITTKDGCGFSSPGAPLMSTLIFLTSWNFSQAVVPKAVIQVSISLQQRKMSWQRQLSKYFMLPNKDPRRAILTETNRWIIPNRQAWLIFLWRRKRQKQVLVHLKRSMECCLQLCLKVPKMAIKQWWREKMERITHFPRQWLLVTALFLLERVKETDLPTNFPCLDLTQMIRNLQLRLLLRFLTQWLALSKARSRKLKLKMYN